MLVQHLAQTTTTKNVAAARFAAGAVGAYDIRGRTQASPIKTDVIRWAPESTSTAVIDVVADIRLAAISRETVTIGKARVAGRDDTGSARTGADSVRQIADMPTNSTVGGVAIQIGFATVADITVTIAKARVAGDLALTHRTGGGAIDGGADMVAGPTVVDITAHIHTGAAAVNQPTLAAQPIGAVARAAVTILHTGRAIGVTGDDTRAARTGGTLRTDVAAGATVVIVDL